MGASQLIQIMLITMIKIASYLISIISYMIIV